MSTSQKRDAEMDRLLRAVLKPASREAAGECPGAEVLAAFVEGRLAADEQSALDSHIVSCSRCQEVLAVLSHDLVSEEATAPARGWFARVKQPRLRWLVPISAAATIAVVFIATRTLIAPVGEVPAGEVAKMAQAPSTPIPALPAESTAARDKAAPIPEKAASTAQAAPEGRSKRAADALAETAPGAEPLRDQKVERQAVEIVAARVASEEKQAKPTAPAPAPSAAPMAAVPQAANVAVREDAGAKQAAADAGRAAPAAIASRKDASHLEARILTVSAPGGVVLWQFGAGGRILRSGDAGETWHPQASGVSADLLAGASPSPATCWLVGTAGTVLLTTDGERWDRRPFPETVDLVAIDASSARAATVTTRDGRRFGTLDAGLTWSPR